ncbi:substrate-binding domain-containing protein [Chryseobacterium antibioticum]|uniref:histidine kinase n=1 Tax=Chryseobacterium pyrolae TaxID=2987481 RepID=A0ABT2IBU3_9FLAO|nr:substrate-binding domain-containing protein [Chryseobacterium pyrolae]MCT2406078.1 substrate-binding domain-containing protein [Chryseobacterium pyrolae]
MRIGFSQGLGNHPWRDAMNHSMQIQASLHPNIDLTVMKADKSVKKQIADIQKMIDGKADIIIISPIDSQSLVPIVEKAYAKGIPVILLDRKIASEKYTTYIGADNIEIGRSAAKYILSDSKSSKEILEIQGDDNSSPSVERSKGFQEVIKKQPDAHLLMSFKGFPAEKFKNTLQSIGQKKLYVFAFNDELASQAWSVARSMGLENNITFIGVDGLNIKDGGIQMVMDGKLSATLLYPSGGAEAIETAIKIHQGSTVPKRIVLGTTIIDQFNAEIMKNQFDRILEQQGTIEHQVEAIEKTTNLYSSQNILLQWSIVLLTTLLCSVAYCIYLIYAVKFKNKELTLNNEKITIQRNQIEHIVDELKESNEARVNFFTGISHEFKTPITLILSSVDSLKENDQSKAKKSGYELELIHKNSNRLLRLIDNLLDFRKVESKTFNLRVSQTNIYDFSYSVYRDFENEAKKRNIKFDIQSNNKNQDIFIDRNLMDKVYFNLLSNAFKFTPDNGKIGINIVEKGNQVIIHFKDNGIGIPKDELHHVFQPYFKGSNNRKNSSGIGLHLSKELVELHLGKIEVTSLQGTEFVITLFKGNKHFNEDQLIREPDLIDASLLEQEPYYMSLEPELTENMNTDELRYTLLLIEDNRDLSQFLKSKLQKEFDVLLSDGTDAIEKALTIVPDIIICDVNLPDKNGFEICEILKKDLRTSHIPTIILTAMDNKESYLQGLKSGVDLYLTKPFNYPILMQSLKSLLFNREKLRYYYTNNINQVSNGTKPFGDLEQQFVSNLNTYISENLDNATFSVENLAESMHVSRVQLYRKVKAIFNENVSDYINNFRLEQSKIMLLGTKLTISEIAYKNGFSSPNYFSTVFKNKYGTSPNTFRKSSTED